MIVEAKLQIKDVYSYSQSLKVINLQEDVIGFACNTFFCNTVQSYKFVTE
jgi:hypothetical protein